MPTTPSQSSINQMKSQKNSAINLRNVNEQRPMSSNLLLNKLRNSGTGSFTQRASSITSENGSKAK